VIQSDCRLTYTIVNEILINPESEYLAQYSTFVPMLLQMGEFSRLLREKRIQRGAIEFGFAECKIIMDAAGKPVEIKPHLRNSATSLIEEFMLACNETIAEEYFWLELPFVFRTHEEPDPEKIQRLSEFINKFGYHLKGSNTHPKAIQKLLANVGNTPEEMLISRLALRSLKQARYTVANEGHFGLAAKYYCHFTSPIRRYPDLQIHRIIKKNIREGFSEEEIEELSEHLPEVCRHSSRAERTAEETEREVNQLKKAQFMADKIGEEFHGIIAGVTRWGIYVELPNTVEGMVNPADLEDDTYLFDEKNMYYIGERKKKTYGLGDPVDVVLTRVYVPEGKIDFVIIED
jgi:ribonuclease R